MKILQYITMFKTGTEKLHLLRCSSSLCILKKDKRRKYCISYIRYLINGKTGFNTWTDNKLAGIEIVLIEKSLIPRLPIPVIKHSEPFLEKPVDYSG